MNFPEYTRKYLLTGLGATPDVLEALLKDIGREDTIWDFTPDAERFTLRSIMAHLADWEPIFLDRIIRTRDENEPELADVDEGQVAIDRNYAASEPRESLARFRAGREALMQTLTDLPSDRWALVARRYFGPITILNQAVLIIGHDGYHTQQVAQWLSAARK
jgi:hypothetical protein